eukprot:CAMPEP_0206585962 /NCGR_PEP_ID=MMETSP0325_2-20121206/36733_1 /ASSEMBLY_ACC=CAM_ASM_000347 /TAXON_ID=2866 /ORGANISM="Crypthecodinium cohnii, Strain Seligo" /LENGTH=940 /DNA_ID=CAMNT_0054093617 /DNA_START=20 /DNA_END=2842 /DNA_ORIENTATION=+
MCAAKLERTGLALRNAWPNIKNFANEQSSNIAQSATESGATFVRKNSNNAQNAANSATANLASTSVSAPSLVKTFAQRTSALARPVEFSNSLQPPSTPWTSVFRPPPGLLAPQQQRHYSAGPVQPAWVSASVTGEPHLASEANVWPPSFPLEPPPGLEGLRPQSDAASTTGSVGRGKSAPTANQDEVRIPKSKSSIDEYAKIAALREDLNPGFWGSYKDIPSMAKVTETEEVLRIVENFALIHRKHIQLFQRLKNTVLKTMPEWSAPQLAALCHAWAQLGFLHEDLCIAMAERVVATAHDCTPQELCYLMDAYATVRCTVPSAIGELSNQTVLKFEDFTLPQLCHHASSFARLNVRHAGLFDAIAERLVRMPVSEEALSVEEEEEEELLSARDVTLAAYSFSKLGVYDRQVFHKLAARGNEVIRDLTARDLQMLAVAFARMQHHDELLLDNLSTQAHRRIAQFNSSSLVLMVRSVAFFGLRDHPFLTRVVAQLPRAILSFRPGEVTMLLNSFAAVQVHSPCLMETITPFLLEKARMLTAEDWLSALRGYSAMGLKDTKFLSAMNLHLDAKKLTLPQLSAAMVDCSRLSFSAPSEQLAEAVLTRVTAQRIHCSDETAAQMFSALALLGHLDPVRSGEAGFAKQLLAQLSLQLGSNMTDSTLTLMSHINLCYAALLAPPGASPLDAFALSKGVAARLRDSSSSSEVSVEGRALLGAVLQALRLMPWNHPAHHTERALVEGLRPGTRPTAYGATSACHLAPCLPPQAWSSSVSWTNSQCSDDDSSSWEEASTATPSDSLSLSSDMQATAFDTRCNGIFATEEVESAMSELQALLVDRDIDSELITDGEHQVHIAIKASSITGRESDSDKRDVALIWGSSLHYISADDSTLNMRLSPSAEFQIAMLRATKNLDVVVIPHWWWPVHASKEGKTQAMMRLLTERSE